MNPTAIYSKSGKGVQEASGKTSLLNRGDRAVLAAIDGRATLADVAQKVGKTFDNAFKEFIAKLDKDGFIREASPGAASAAAKPAAAAAKPGAKPAGKAEDAGGFGDLDFSSMGGGAAPKAAPAPSRPAPPPPKPAAPPPKPAAPPPAPKPNPAADEQAKAQQSALQKAREEAEAKADAERQRIKLEAEAKMRSEMESQARDEAAKKLKAEAEAKVKAEADAKIRAAQEAAARVAAEAKAKADAEAKARVDAERKAREEAERARKAAEEEARKVREEAERVRKAAEEEARKAREEAERARKEAEQARKEAEEAARKAREEAERRAKEEAEAMRRKHEEERKREEEEERAAKRRQREEEEEREAQEAAAAKAAKKKKKDEDAPAPAAAKSEAASGLDSLLNDLDSFTTREEEDRKAQEEADRKAQEAASRRAREDEERRQKEEAERREKEEARERKQSEKQRKREDEEALAKKREADEKRLREEEEKRKREADERERKAKAEEVLAAQANRGPARVVGEDTDEVRKRMVGRRSGAAAAAPISGFEAPSRRRKKSGWGKPVAITLVLLLLAAVGYVHVMPLQVADYERAASEALGRPVKIGEAGLSLLGGGLQIKMKNIRLGDDVRIASGTATPDFEALRSEKKTFSRIELEGVELPQDVIGQALLARLKADNFSVQRVVVKKVELTGAAVLPKPLEIDLAYGGDGALTQVTVRGPDTLVARITPGQGKVEYVVTASGLPLPVLPQVTLSDFGMKGTADQRGMQITEWGGKLYGGSVSGTANIRWSSGWTIDGVVTARNINAAVFAPALLSEGKGEGTGRFSMSGADPSKLASGGRLDGNFTIGSGALGSIDLGRVIRSGGREYAGRTPFNDLTGQATYDKGAVSLRNVAIGAGALNAGASADIAQSGALSGRIVVDVKSTSGGGRSANATLQLGGTIREPLVKN